MRLGQLQRLPVADPGRRDRRLGDQCAAYDLDDCQRVPITVRIDTDHVVHFLCEHGLHLQLRLGA